MRQYLLTLLLLFSVGCPHILGGILFGSDSPDDNKNDSSGTDSSSYDHACPCVRLDKESLQHACLCDENGKCMEDGTHVCCTYKHCTRSVCGKIEATKDEGNPRMPKPEPTPSPVPIPSCPLGWDHCQKGKEKCVIVPNQQCCTACKNACL